MVTNGPLKPSSTVDLVCKVISQEGLRDWKDLELLSQSGVDHALVEEGKKWLAFAKDFGDNSEWQGKLRLLDSHLLKRSVLNGYGMSLSVVDFAVFVVLRDTLVKCVIPTSQGEYRNVVRWFDYVQCNQKVASIFEKVAIKKPVFEPQDHLDLLAKKQEKPDSGVENTKEKQLDSNRKPEDKKGKDDSSAQKNDEKKVTSSTSKKDEKKGKDDTASSQKKDENKGKEDSDVSVSLLDIRVGLIVKVWKHPSADSLLVEEIDMGEIGVRQVVSGLAKFVKEEDMLNRKVAVISNVKPGKLRDVVSSGLVLCASSSDHTVVEPLLVPDGATVGEKISFAGHEGKPEDVLNPKKKQLDKILPGLVTDENGIATYRGIPFMTTAGPCKSSLVQVPIK